MLVATQVRALVCTLRINIPPKPKRKFTARLSTWKLRDPACAADFMTAFDSKCGDAVVDSQAQSNEDIWEILKSNLDSAAESVCDRTVAMPLMYPESLVTMPQLKVG